MSIAPFPARSAPASAGTGPGPIAAEHVRAVLPVVAVLAGEAERLTRWGELIADRLLAGGRLLAAGNGGSAAEAQHLTAEFVGRFDGERRAFPAICLHGDSSALTAIGNDYGYEEVFARQIRAHAGPGDVAVLLSTSGRSPNLVRAAAACAEVGAVALALTGAGPNPLAQACDDALALPGPSASVQEAHLIAVHALCRVFDHRIRESEGVG